MNIQLLVNQIPLILQYFVPGFVFISLFCFFETKKISDKLHAAAISITASYIINALLKITVGAYTSSSLFLSVLIAIVAGILAPMVIHSDAMSQILSQFASKSINDNIFRDIIDFKLGCTVQLYDKDGASVYEGAVFFIAENDAEPWISLIGYHVYSITENGFEETLESDYKYKTLTVKLSNISRVEIFYGENTNVIPEKFKEFLNNK